MNFYDKLAASALRLLKSKGQRLTFRRYSGTFNPVQGQPVDIAFIAGAMWAVSLPVSEAPRSLTQLLKEDMSIGDARFLIAAVEPGSTLTAPLVSDIVLLESDYWRVHGQSVLNPAGTALLYYVLLYREPLTQAYIDAMELTGLETAVTEVDNFINTDETP